MKKSILFLCLLFIQDISYSQTMEIIADVREDKIVTDESILIGDILFSTSTSVYNVKAFNLKTKKEVEKKIEELNSKYHVKSNLKSSMRFAMRFSPGRAVDGNVQYLIASMDKDDKVNLTRTTLDANLKVVEEVLLISYDVKLSGNNGNNLVERKFKYDDQLDMYFYGEYFPLPRKDDYFRSVILNSKMEITSDNEYDLANNTYALDMATRILHSAKVIDAQTTIVNIAGALYAAKPNSFQAIPLKLKYNINNYVIQSNGKKGIRLIGNYEEEKGVQGLVIIDFDENLEVSFEKYLKMPPKMNVSQKEITGKGEDQNIKSRGFTVKAFKVNSDGTTDIVLDLSNAAVALNISFLKLDKEGVIMDQLVVPYGYESDFNILFNAGKIIVFYNDFENWYEENGKFNSESYPNRRDKSLILCSMTVPTDGYEKFKRNQVLLEDAKPGEFNWKKQILKFHKIKVDSNSYLMTIEVNGPPAIGKVFYTQYIGKISL